MIRTFSIPVLGFALAAAGAHAQPNLPGSSGVLVRGAMVRQMQTVDVGEFHPAVAAIDSGGFCEVAPNTPLGAGQRMLMYTFRSGDARVRSVVVVVDSADQLVRYSDLRGDLRGSGSSSVSDANPLGPRTSITLNAPQGFGVLRNSGTAEPDEPMQVKVAALLDAPILGVPRRMIEHVLNVCRQN